jgi:hypothetical protein
VYCARAFFGGVVLAEDDRDLAIVERVPEPARTLFPFSRLREKTGVRAAGVER